MRIAITAFKPTVENKIEKITRLIFDCDCRIEKIRTLTESGVFVGIFIIDGVWNQIAKLERNLKSNLSDFTISIQRIEDDSGDGEFIPYLIETIGADHPGTLHKIIEFFTSHNLNIRDINGNRFPASQSQTMLYSSQFIIGLPLDCRIISLRDEFLEYCDELSIDAVFEPIKR